MRFMTIRRVSITAALFVGAVPSELYAWHDRTHLAIAEAGGFELWYSAAAPDVAKSKEQFTAIESPNHYFNNNAGREVTAAMVSGQVEKYDKPDEGEEGHLYGAVIGAVRAYRTAQAKGKYARYPLVYCAHYIGDLSMPLHNTPYDDFNRARHGINDGIIDGSVRDSVSSIRKRLTRIVIRDEADLAREIAVVGESARRLGVKMRREKRNMTPYEAYQQVIRSASLLKAVLAYAEHPEQTDPDTKL